MGRSEKLEILQKRDVKQVVDEANLPKFWNKWEVKKNELIIRPAVEIEVPDFIALAEELLEAELEAQRAAEAERLRIWNARPMAYLTLAQQKKKQRKEELRAKNDDNLPAWFVNPLKEDEDDFFVKENEPA